MVPQGWEIAEQQGFRRTGKDVFPTNVVAVEESLPEETPFPRYVENQVAILREILPNPSIQWFEPPVISGALERKALLIRYASLGNALPVVQRQLYACARGQVGILIMTTIESELPNALAVFDAICASCDFHPASVAENEAP